MRIAILHYHLRPGGVTRVIQNALAALSETGIQTIVFSGEPPSSSMHVEPYAIIESLGYHDLSPQRSPEDIVKDLKSIAKQHLGDMPDVWHIHNHALGKNLLLSEIVYLLAQQGQHLLLQIHDFAEDGRPDNYKFLREHLCPNDPGKLGSRLYPQASHVHYALLNQRDLNFLKASGVHPDRLHHLPNPVSMEKATMLESTEQQAGPGNVYLYPVRAIRRKNIGEFLFWSSIAQEGERFAITRSPKNPRARPVYEDWVAFAQSLQLPVEFGIGETWQGDFCDLLRSASKLVTTSVAEGFGLAFLEPWLLLRPLIGRKLPEISDEFENIGVELSTLYNRLEVPLEWIGRDRFQQEVQTALSKAYEAYDRNIQENEIRRAVNASLTGDYVDFGRLNEGLQKIVIGRLVQDSSSKEQIYPSTLCWQPGNLNDLIQRNCNTVMKQFNLPKYRGRLLNIYQSVANSESSSVGELNATLLLDQFLAPERFCLLRT